MDLSHSPMMRAFLLSLSLLTRLPVTLPNNIDRYDSGRSALFYPLVGLIIGLITLLPIGIFSNASPILLGAIVVALWAAITGGLHLDGLADSADAWLGGMGDREKTQRIMKDPLVGAAGVVAIVCILLLKFSAVTVLIQQGSLWGLALAPMVARNMVLLLFLTSEYVSSRGIAHHVVDYLPRTIAWSILIVISVMCGLFSVYGTLWVLIGFGLIRRLSLKRLGGYTGDIAGVVVEITETLYLVGCGLVV
jgi:adenosylcobinamide-GDP ribazoletransferase